MQTFPRVSGNNHKMEKGSMLEKITSVMINEREKNECDSFDGTGVILHQAEITKPW